MYLAYNHAYDMWKMMLLACILNLNTTFTLNLNSTFTLNLNSTFTLNCKPSLNLDSLLLDPQELDTKIIYITYLGIKF
jgi:hypothetical protein